MVYSSIVYMLILMYLVSYYWWIDAMIFGEHKNVCYALKSSVKQESSSFFLAFQNLWVVAIQLLFKLRVQHCCNTKLSQLFGTIYTILRLNYDFATNSLLLTDMAHPQTKMQSRKTPNIVRISQNHNLSCINTTTGSSYLALPKAHWFFR